MTFGDYCWFVYHLFEYFHAPWWKRDVLFETDDIDIKRNFLISRVDETDGMPAIFSLSAPIFDAVWKRDVLQGVSADEIFVLYHYRWGRNTDNSCTDHSHLHT